MTEPKNWLLNPVTGVLATLVLVVVVVYLAVATSNQVKQGRYIGRPATERDTITIQGEGKVTAIPDIGEISVGIVTKGKDVAKAQKDNITQFNKLVEALKSAGVEKKDLTTSNYSVNPTYEWPDGRQVMTGYEVRQSLQVKIRDLDKAGDIVSIASQNGVNEVGNLNFTIDEPETLRAQAREKALENAKEKAIALTKLTGSTLGKIVSFSESSYGGNPQPIYYTKDMMVRNEAAADAAPAPSFEAGSQDIVVNATIQYEIY